jgi:hypothetical protein
MPETSKNILKSKTFWFNIAGAIAEYSGYIPVAPGTALLISNGINIGLRYLTTKPVTILPK